MATLTGRRGHPFDLANDLANVEDRLNLRVATRVWTIVPGGPGRQPAGSTQAQAVTGTNELSCRNRSVPAVRSTRSW